MVLKGVVENNPSCVAHLSDEDLRALIMAIDKSRDQIGSLPGLDMFPPAVFHLNPYPLVAKGVPKSFDNEAFMMEYVARHTNIPIPRVHRVLPSIGDSRRSWIIMDFIEGDCLFTVWPKLSWRRRLSVALTLRSYIQQLRRTPLPNPSIPGPFDQTGAPRLCYGEPFDSHGDGPFPTLESLASWFDNHSHRVQILQHQAGWTDFPRYEEFDRSEPLVLCHNDLGHLRNIILDKEGRLWLIDWAFAGAYPAQFEYIPFDAWADAASPDRRPPLSFTRLVRSGLIVGGPARWYYDNYARSLYQSIEAFGRRALDADYFAKLGISREAWKPKRVARPPFTFALGSKILDMIYDTILAVFVRFSRA
ncbi:hypothetical protein CYLTODRAFT_488896 [Cylindrobasidium torrendii FP15055 ss-10]|uniref:Aminoglycoside phosphotransferase domain-containing protein n=1 Tax=Cylindrobasidium torrendii FP15055 ss-10 TaxID=1314674 RepID=A0A0D7BH51_9AGAR|nr:hypothetical protein CYLTODRAFT_488896 [Cylindrobasidium torrendii FP15055 ss-10]